jgi:hypothetical protein
MPQLGFEPTIPVWASKDCSCVGPRGHCDRTFYLSLTSQVKGNGLIPSLNPSGRILKKLVVALLVKIFSVLYGTIKFINMFKTARQ